MKYLLDSKDRAQTLLEFALLLPLLLMFAFFILDFGRAVYYYSALYNGAREGARFGTTAIQIYEYSPTNPFDGSADQAQIAVVSKKHIYGINPADVTVSSKINTESTTQAVRFYIEVTTAYTYTPVTPFLSIILPSGINLSSSSQMRIEPLIKMQLLLTSSLD